ncbi:hypothetical protein FHG87_019274 [Trinorchestia longiramus]|nr:hypothetical protein FHG87_019274 [Trinorchestia longiramus]
MSMLVQFGGHQCCHRAVRLCCQILLILGLLAGLSLLAAAATLHGNTGPDVRLVALVYIGGLVVCVCGGLLVVFCASAAVDSTFPEATLIPSGDFWNDPCVSQQYYGGLHGTGNLNKTYFNDQHTWSAKEVCCQSAELPDINKCDTKTSTKASYCAYENKCIDEHTGIEMQAYTESCGLENKYVNRNGCVCGNFIIENKQPNLQEYHTLHRDEHLDGDIVGGQYPFSAVAAEERGIGESISCGKSGTSEKICSSFLHCNSESTTCPNCKCLEHKAKIFCPCDEGPKFQVSASENPYAINSLCQSHSHSQTSCPASEGYNLHKEINNKAVRDSPSTARKSRSVNFSPAPSCRRCVRKVEFCGACVHNYRGRSTQTKLRRDERTSDGL